jgi:S-formylglutathione hydrolase FrmB
MGRPSGIAAAPVALLIVVALLGSSGAGGIVVPAHGTPPFAPSARAGHLPGRVDDRRTLANGIVISTVDYSSSVDGFPLSYSEVLPAGYLMSEQYPLLVELHGIDVTLSTPMPGGYPTALDNETMNETSAAGFILIVPNTRTDDGFYVDSLYTGPQAQDILDAIATEKTLRLIGAVYLYGFSMGSMGALSIGLQHPGEFAGIGSIATFSDIYQLYEYQVETHSDPLNDALLNLTGGLLPNASSYAAQIFDELSELRQHPELTKGIRMYLVSGGEDDLAPDNTTLWPYLQGNDTALQTTCLVAFEIGEPENCTLPLAALNAVDPTNFSYRFVYEWNGIHSYRQVNVTDMLKFFLGEAPSGPYIGTFPDPTVAAPRVPLVTIATQPFSCGTVWWNGTVASDGDTFPVPVGSYPVVASPCPGYRFTGFVGRGGVVDDAAAGTASVEGVGALVAEFSPVSGEPSPSYSVTVAASNGCPSVSLNGTAVPSGSAVTLPAGEYVAEAAPCDGWAFESWSWSGGVRVWSTADPITGVALAANGTLEANYVIEVAGKTIEVFVTPSSCGPILLNGTGEQNGSVIDLALGTYPLAGAACAGYLFAGWSSSGGVTVAGSFAVTTLVVASDGTVTAIYSPSSGGAPARLDLSVVPSWCGAVISLNGGRYSDGGTAELTPGTYALDALNCTQATFRSWTSTGNATVSGPWLVLTGNGTLGASYAIDTGLGAHTSNGTSSGGLPWSSDPYLAGAIGLAAGLVVGLVAMGLGRSRSKTPGGAPRDPPK